MSKICRRVVINKDVRQVIEPHLDDDETLLWAEKTCHQTQQLHKDWFELTSKKKRILTAILMLGLLGMLIGLTVSSGIDNWGTSVQQRLADILSIESLYAVVAAAVLLFLSFLVKGRVYNVGAYGLTNKRLFELNHDFEIIRHLDASRVKTVYGSEGVTIKPIGAKGFRSYQLGLMNNSTLTINYLHRQITEARRQES